MNQFFFFVLYKFCNMCKIRNRILQVNNLAKSKLQYDVKTKYRLMSRKFSCMTLFHPSVRLTNQKPRTFVYIRPINQSQMALFPFVCCFCFVRAFSFQGHTKITLFGLVCGCCCFLYKSCHR